MMKLLRFVPLILILIYSSCEKNNELVDITSDCEFPEIIVSSCFYGSPPPEYYELVFRDNESYREYGDIVKINPINLNCDTAQLLAIDFSKYTLLSKMIMGGGCSANFDRKVFMDVGNRKIIYQVKADFVGSCEMLITNRNWVLIPAITNNYTVEFRVK